MYSGKWVGYSQSDCQSRAYITGIPGYQTPGSSLTLQTVRPVSGSWPAAQIAVISSITCSSDPHLWALILGAHRPWELNGVGNAIVVSAEVARVLLVCRHANKLHSKTRLGEKRVKGQEYTLLSLRRNQVSSDEYVVAAAFCPEHKETFITAAGVREERGFEGWGVSAVLWISFFNPYYFLSGWKTPRLLPLQYL